MSEPLVSAIILCRNRERYIGEAIESVRGQTYGSVELVVVDDSSTDATREVVDRYEPEVRAWIKPQRGLCPGRNVGLSIARGDYMGFLDSDDLWEPDKVERQVAMLEGEGAPDLVLGHASQFASPDLPEELAARLRVPATPQPAKFLGAMLAHRRTWDRVGPWTKELRVSEGLDWFLRAGALGLDEAMLEEVVIRRRVHGDNVGIHNREDRGEFTRLLKDRLNERRRQETL